MCSGFFVPANAKAHGECDRMTLFLAMTAGIKMRQFKGCTGAVPIAR